MKEVKKKKRKMLLGDNPFGEIESIDFEYPKNKTRINVKKGYKKVEKKTAISTGSPEVAIDEAEKKIDEVLESVATQKTQSRDSLVEFAERIQSKMAAIQLEAGEEKRIFQALLKAVRPSFYLRKLAPFFLTGRGVEVDEFGRDEKLERNLLPVLKWLFDHYFRVEVQGVENIPPSGGCVVVANHAPVLALDGLMIRHAIVSRVRSDARLLLENELYFMPYVGILAQRIGVVRASQENASWLLSKGCAVITFPEGILGISRTFKERYGLKRFGRGGYVRLAIKNGVPVIPAALVGPQNSFPIIWKTSIGAKYFSIPFIPVTPTFPFFGPLGLIPLPLKWKIRFSEPLKFDYPAGENLDQATVNKLNNQVREIIQKMIDDLRN